MKYIFLLIFILLQSCANRVSPTGGEVDLIAPEIISTYPLNNTTNYKENFVTIEFSEYIDKRSVQESIFISPKLNNALDFDWSGRELSFYWKDTLLKNTTYTITIGTEVEDLNNRNKMEKAFNLSFSTGNKIDVGRIAGRVYDDNSDGVMIFGYNIKSDTVNILNKEPDYISQIGPKGDFLLQGLSDGKYQIYAVRDEFRDFKYNKSQDYFGAPFQIIELGGQDTSFTDLNFYLTFEDTIKPSLNNVIMTDNHHIIAEFSEFIDSTYLNLNNVKVLDTVNTNSHNIERYFLSSNGSNKIIFCIDDSLSTEYEYVFQIDSIIDKSKNLQNVDKISFVTTNRPDTTNPKLIKIESELPENVIANIFPKLKFYFDDAFDVKLFEKGLEVESNKRKLNYSIDLIDNASFTMNLLHRFKPKTEINVKIDLKYFSDIAGNYEDSVYVEKFTTINNLDYSGAEGSVVTESNLINPIIVLRKIDSKLSLKEKISSNKSFHFKDVVPGKYLLWLFEDKDSNSVYSNGKYYPFSESEKFKYYPDTLNLRARWPVGEIKFYYH